MKQERRKTVAAILWLAFSCVIHIVLFRDRLDTDLPIVRRFLFVILAVAVTLPLHEMIHWVFMKIFGMKDAGIGFARDPMGIPSLRASARGEVHGAKRMVIFLTPFLLLTLVPDILFLLSDRVPFLFFIVAMCNAAGCYFDLTDVVGELKAGR